MLGNKTVACIIPARLKSTRFPRKMLALLKGKPLIQWVWEAAKRVSLFDHIAIAVDSDEVKQAVGSFGGKCFMTSPDCQSGTDRLIELKKKKLIDADIWINWQGDEPFISAQMIEQLLQTAAQDTADVWTLKRKISPEQALDPNLVKVVCDKDSYALYFSRSVIPFYRDPKSPQKLFFGHVGLYAYSLEALKKIAQLEPSYLEQAEQLEQLRFLSHGLRIQVHDTDQETLGIDLPEHLALAEKWIK